MNHLSVDHHHELQDLALRRHESRYTGQKEPLCNLPANLQEQIYSEPVTTTVYIGIPDIEGTEKDISSEGFIRFRFRTRIPTPSSRRVWLPDMEQLGTLELKLRFQEVGHHEPTEKTVIEHIRLGDALELLHSDDTRSAPDDAANFLEKTKQLFASHKLSPKDVTLLAFSQATRRHFIWKSAAENEKVARVTVDTGMSLWLCGQAKKQRLIFAKKVRSLPEAKVEIKAGSDAPLDSSDEQVILSELFGSHDYVKDRRIKRRHFFDILEERGRPKLVSGEDANLASSSYIFLEKEIKIDCETDPTEYLHQAPGLGLADTVLGPGFTYEMYFKYLQFSNGKVLRVKSDDIGFSHPIFQYKQQQKIKDESILARKKTSRTSLEDFDFKLDRSSCRQSLIAKRDELFRTVVCLDTENLFVIIADHCTALGVEPLNQIEIEFLGKLGYPDDYGDGFDSDNIDEDLKAIATEITAGLKRNSIKILSSRTTKETWLAGAPI